MAKLEVRNLTKMFGKVRAADGFNFSVEEGEWLTLLGPSGCGKTTALRLIAGFLKPDKGEILVDGKIVSSPENSIPPEKRDMGMVFQSYAVWPHMTVFHNVAFGLKLKKMSRDEIQKRVNKILDLVKLSGLADRFPNQLSGGQQQRVAVARSLVTETQIILFDEPLSNLDAKLREELRFELRELQLRLGFTSVYVTHDQSEALVMSDRICIMNSGYIEQIGKPWEIYHQPRSKFVSEFVGLTNFIEGHFLEMDKGAYIVNCEQLGTIFRVVLLEEINLQPNSTVTISIRPEAIMIIDETDGTLTDNVLMANVRKVSFLGNMIDYRMDANGVELRIQELTQPDKDSCIVKEGNRVKIWFKPERCAIIV